MIPPFVWLGVLIIFTPLNRLHPAKGSNNTHWIEVTELCRLGLDSSVIRCRYVQPNINNGILYQCDPLQNHVQVYDTRVGQRD
jgi:hypothetical protein